MKQRGMIWMAVVGLAAMTSGCGLFGDDYDVDFETGEEEYVANTSTTISMTIENTGNNVVFYRCGGDMHIERFADGELDDSFGALPNCASLDPKPIESGETENRDLPLDENVIKWLNERAAVAVQGGVPEITYRLRLELFEDTEFMHELEHEEERSNAFVFRWSQVPSP